MVDPFAESLDALGQFSLVDAIIAQAAGIIVPLAKPSIIQHKQFAAQFLGLLCQVQKLSLVEIKHAAFPVIVKNGTAAVLPVSGDDML